MQCHHGHHCPAQTVFDPPVRVVRNIYHPQLVRVIHPIEVVNRHHCVPVYEHCYTVIEKNEQCSVSAVKKGKRSAR